MSSPVLFLSRGRLELGPNSPWQSSLELAGSHASWEQYEPPAVLRAGDQQLLEDALVLAMGELDGFLTPLSDACACLFMGAGYETRMGTWEMSNIGSGTALTQAALASHQASALAGPRIQRMLRIICRNAAA